MAMRTRHSMLPVLVLAPMLVLAPIPSVGSASSTQDGHAAVRDALQDAAAR